jgi:uncharacterized LabA/DUF88 family protein
MYMDPNSTLTASETTNMISSRSALGSKPALTDPELAEPRGFSFLRHNSLTFTAVLVDAGFFLKRAAVIYGHQTPEATAKQLHRIALDHLNDEHGHRVARLYRIFVYDAPPAEWKGHMPISKVSIDCGRSDLAQWRNTFHQNLRSLRKVALRLGHIPTTQVHWQLKQDSLRALVGGRREWVSICDDDFILSFRQKGVDMRIGLDIASLAYGGRINQLVLISGDSDFVPAAKLARREGIDFVLDPMWSTIRPDLHENTDGLRSVCPRPGRTNQ